MIVEIWVRVGSCEKDAGCEKADRQDRADKFWKAGSGGIYGCHAEKASAISSDRPEMWLSLLVSLSSSNLVSPMVSKPEITGSHSDRVDCKCWKFPSELLKFVWLQRLLSLVSVSSFQVSSSSSSEK